jgi:hypothetical protein
MRMMVTSNQAWEREYTRVSIEKSPVFTEWCAHPAAYSKVAKSAWQAPMAHACNPSYSEGRDQEDRGLKPAQARPYLKNALHKTGLEEWIKV